MDGRPGQLIRQKETGDTRTLLRRKEGEDAQLAPGWWLTDGSGLADWVLDDYWELLDEHAPVPARYGVGPPLDRAVYDGETFIGIMETPELAALVVNAFNVIESSPGRLVYRGPTAALNVANEAVSFLTVDVPPGTVVVVTTEGAE